MENCIQLGERKIKLSGRSFYIRVPKQLVDNKILALDQRYRVFLEPASAGNPQDNSDEEAEE